MAKEYKIDIGVGVKEDRKGVSDLRERISQAREIRKQAGKGTGWGIETSNFQLNKNIQKIVKSNEDLIRALKENTRTARRGDGGRRGGPSGRGIDGASGVGISRIGASTIIPGLGLALGIAGFAIHQMMRVGKAHLAKAQEQIMTAGIAGTRTGMESYFSAAQAGEFVKARRMAAGTYKSPGGDQRMTALYAKRFGLSGADVGKQLGIMDLMTGGYGGKNFARIIETAHQKGIQTEMPLMINMITDSLEQAVEAGVNASNLATDLAGEISRNAAYSPNASIRPIIAMTRNLMQLQQQVSRGQYSGVSNWRMFEAGREKVTKAVLGRGGKTGDRIVQSLIAGGTITQREVEQIRKAGNISPIVMEYLTRSYLQKTPEEARTAYMKDIVGTLGKGKTGLQRRAMLANRARQFGITENVAETDYYYRVATGQKISDRFTDVKRPAFDEGKWQQTTAFAAQGLQNAREAFLLTSKAAQYSARQVIKFEKILIQLATTLEGTVSKSLNDLLKRTNKKSSSFLDIITN